MAGFKGGDLVGVAIDLVERLAGEEPDRLGRGESVAGADGIRWRRFTFRRTWCWKSRRKPGRPLVDIEVRRLIRQILTRLVNPRRGLVRQPRLEPAEVAPTSHCWIPG